jgi:glycine dehydrogenase subunit 1
MYNFLPHTEAERQLMLAKIGVKNIDALFSDIPTSLRQNIEYTVLPSQGLTEMELQAELQALAHQNKGTELACFLGGGAYNRFIPMAVNTIASRSEFYTAYTPYQPEIAQGTLQVTYEFQTMICELTGMDVANASVYDGASAVTEAAFMAMRTTRRNRILVANSVNPDYRKVLETYAKGLGEVSVDTFDPLKPGEILSPHHPQAQQTACVVMQIPNYWGGLEDPKVIQQFCEATGALFIVSAEPVSLGLLKAPGSYGADIVTGDIQPLGNNLSFGGPYGGYIATKSKYVRQLPGRLVGKTVDRNGKQCYTLTLQTREQHIRREKATSNICTNQALNVLKATVYMTLVGPNGLKHLANLSLQRTHTLASQLRKLPGITLYQAGQPFFAEVALRFPVPVAPLLQHLEQQGILAGIALERFYPDAQNCLLIACTEMTLPSEIDRYVQAVKEYLKLNAPPGTPQPAELLQQMEATC